MTAGCPKTAKDAAMLLLATDLNGHLRVHPKRVAFMPHPGYVAPKESHLAEIGGGCWQMLRISHVCCHEPRLVDEVFAAWLRKRSPFCTTWHRPNPAGKSLEHAGTSWPRVKN